jgi:hypothetical protein
MDASPAEPGWKASRLTSLKYGFSQHRPPRPSLNNGPVQRRVRRAFIAMGKARAFDHGTAGVDAPARSRHGT